MISHQFYYQLVVLGLLWLFGMLCTVLQWLVEAAGQLTAFTRDFLCDVYVNQLQLDELYAVLRNVNDGEFSEDDASNGRRADRSRVVPERRDALSGAAVGAASCSIRDWQG